MGWQSPAIPSLQPRGDKGLRPSFGRNQDGILRMTLITGDRRFAIIDYDMTMTDCLSGRRNGRCKTEPKQDVVQSHLQKLKQHFAGGSLHLASFPDVSNQLRFGNSVIKS